jgi:hypothetical protein
MHRVASENFGLKTDVDTVTWLSGPRSRLTAFFFLVVPGNRTLELYRKKFQTCYNTLSDIKLKLNSVASVASELYRQNRRLSAKLVPTFLRIEGATWSA